jgi:hypothetical protein
LEIVMSSPCTRVASITPIVTMMTERSRVKRPEAIGAMGAA